MKRYWLFAGSFYYPNGGIHDLVGQFESIEDASANLKIDGYSYDFDEADIVVSGGFPDYFMWAYVYDTEKSEIVKGLTMDGVTEIRLKVEAYKRGLDYYKRQYGEPTPYIVMRAER